MSAPVLVTEQVVKRFGEVTAVDGIDLAVEENAFFALLGPSGCGKTTLLRLIAGFEQPSAGRLSIAGRDMSGVAPNRRPVNMMFQSYALFPHMTVAGNVAYGLEAEGVPRAEIRRRVGEMLEMTELSALASRRPAELSGGQRQRAALARALVKRPRILLLDEPLSALDRRLREQMQYELRRMQTEVGITFIVVTHDQEEALTMASRMAVLNAGRIAQIGAPHDLYERPANRFAARFLGEMNFLEGALVPGGLEVAGLGFVRGVGTVTAGKGCAAVRPERLILGAGAPEGANAFPGTVVATTYHGAGQSLRVRLAATDLVLTVTRTSAEADAAPLAPEATVTVAFRPEHTTLLGDEP